MKRTLILSFSLITFGYGSIAQSKQVAFTIDDLPVISYSVEDPFYLWNVTLNIISTFDKAKIPAVGFVNEGQLYKEGVLDSSALDLLKLWFQNGYEIGNHTYSHGSYSQLTFAEYTEDIMNGEKISRHLEQEYNKELRYFRHPFLQVGATKGRYDSLNAFLKEKQYIVAPVTIVNQDWVFANAYAKAEREKNPELMAQIGDEYIAFSEQCVLQAERQSQLLFDQNISHTLLIHANKLNADYLDELADVFEDIGYEFVTLEEALEDKLYETEITFFKTYGSSWLQSWAESQGKTESFFDGGAQIPDWIKNPE